MSTFQKRLLGKSRVTGSQLLNGYCQRQNNERNSRKSVIELRTGRNNPAVDSIRRSWIGALFFASTAVSSFADVFLGGPLVDFECRIHRVYVRFTFADNGSDVRPIVQRENRKPAGADENSIADSAGWPPSVRARRRLTGRTGPIPNILKRRDEKKSSRLRP